MATQAASGRSISFLGAVLSAAALASQSAAAALSIPQPLASSLERAASHAQEVRCLADAIYYEAANQPLDGRRAVAQVVLNRLRNPHYPKTVCGVVYQGASARGCQFTFACDGSLARLPTLAGRRDAEAIAEDALGGGLPPTVGGSTHYHTLAVHPYWSASLTPTVRIGAHQFYSSPGQPVTLVAQASPSTPLDAATAPAAPQASRFTVWGLQVAQVSPVADGVTVLGAEPTP